MPEPDTASVPLPVSLFENCAVLPPSIVMVAVPAPSVTPRAVVKLSVSCNVAPPLMASPPEASPRLLSARTASVPADTVVPPV
ncbi:hypothetical protein DK59_3185 [Brucella abortus bv. 4 str. 292]|nr:hypothetical protein DK59_3185 [Brucella abortus bv. 4 str. 292]